MAYELDEFESELDRLAAKRALHAKEARDTAITRAALAAYNPTASTARRTADADVILLRAVPRPAPERRPSGKQIALTAALALGLGLSLGIALERTWTETNAEISRD